MDVCCFNRPQDDPSIGRNRIEAEAVLSILRRVQEGQWVLVGSEVVDAELHLCPSPERQVKAAGMAAMRSSCVMLASPQVLRARELNAMGFGSMDAFMWPARSLTNATCC